MCISMCICLAGFTWAAAETSVTENRPGLPTAPRCISAHADDTACGKCMVNTPVLPPSFSSSPFSASSQGPTFNSLPCQMRCKLTIASSPPPLDAIVLQGIALPQHADTVPGPCSRIEFFQFSAQGHSTRLRCRASRCLLSLLLGQGVLINFCKGIQLYWEEWRIKSVSPKTVSSSVAKVLYTWLGVMPKGKGETWTEDLHSVGQCCIC